jgi:hypothetical protein
MVGSSCTGRRLICYRWRCAYSNKGGSWRGNDNKFLWTSATDDVFRDCFIPTTTPDKGPLQFEIDEQLNTTWYKE